MFWDGLLCTHMRELALQNQATLGVSLQSHFIRTWLLRDISMEISGNKLSKELILEEGSGEENSPADSTKRQSQILNILETSHFCIIYFFFPQGSRDETKKPTRN